MNNLNYNILSELNMGDNVVIFPGCTIGRPPMAPAGTTIIDYSKIESKPVYIGDGTIIGSNVVIYNDVKIGKNCLIGDSVHIRENVSIGDNCIIGISTKVGARTIIGNNTRIMDLTNVASDALIGNNVFFGPGATMGNDNAMGRNIDFSTGKGPIVEDWATIGMNSTILPGIRIGQDALIAAGSVVTKDVKASVVVMGVPARFVRYLNEEEKRCD